MATTEVAERQSRERLAVGVLVGLVALVGGLAAYHFLSRPPQMGADDEVFDTVDALYTAVGSRDEKRLGQCEQRLNSYRDAGKLPAEPAEYLAGVIATARGGGWESAAKRLYDFMLAQRREGATGHQKHPHKHDTKPAKR